MKEYWYIFLIAILCAIFSKQIDNLVAKVIKDGKKRVIIYCVFCVIMLTVNCFLIYGALNTITKGFHTVILAALPILLFVIGIVVGKGFKRFRQKK